MGRTLIYIGLAILLGFGVYYFLFKEHDLYNKKEAAFKISDTASIAKIFMNSKNGHQVTLTRSEDGWLLDGRYRATQATINTLLRTIALQDAVYPVPETMHNNVITMLAARAVKVELYDKEGKIIRVYYVGGQANDNSGTFMLMEGAERPYVVQIQGFPGSLASRYSTIFDDWRDRLLVDVPKENLKSVRVEYVNEPLNSYTFNRSQDGILSVTLDPSLNFSKSSFNESRANDYAGFFEDLYCEGFINGTEYLREMLQATSKRCVVDVEPWLGQKQHIEVYWMPLNKRSKNQVTPFADAPASFDADRYYAVANNFKDTVILQRHIFEKIFRRGYDFYQQNDTSSSNVEGPLNTRAGSVIMPK